MIKSGSLKRLWYHCLELEGLIRSHMELNIYKIKREMPETVITGDTSDISTISSNGWYDWIKLYDPVCNSFPEDKYYNGRYLGLAIDISPALTQKILKMNGEVVRQSTYQSLTAQKMNNEEYLRRDFDKNIEEKLRTKAIVKYFDDNKMEETPTFEMYGNHEGNKVKPDKPLEKMEPTPYLSTDV